MEMNGGSTASHLVRSLRPLVYAHFNRFVRLPGATWDRFRCTVEPSPRHIRYRKNRRLKITSASTERQKRSQNLAPVLVIISGNSLVFSRKTVTSTGFYLCCAAGPEGLGEQCLKQC